MPKKPLNRLLKELQDLQQYANQFLSSEAQSTEDIRYLGRALLTLSEIIDKLSEEGIVVDVRPPRYLGDMDSTIRAVYDAVESVESPSSESS